MNRPLSRRRFLAATAAAGAGITFRGTSAAAPEKPALLGGTPVRKDGFPGWPVFDEREEKETFASRSFQAIYGKDLLARWEERTRCPRNDRLCEEAVWLGQTMLLGPRKDMEDIAEAVRKVQAHAGELARA